MIDVLGTGLDGSGALLGDNAADANWSVTSSPLGAFTPVTIAADGFPIPPWVGFTSDSRWIGPDDVSGNSDGPNGSYTYETSFTLSGDAILSTASIQGQFAADDSAELFLNGNSIATSSGFSSFTSFTINTEAFFTAGTNFLTVVVVNSGVPGESSITPTGLQLDITETFVELTTEIPVPASILMLMGALGAAGVTFRKKAAA
ncbi:MAG: hypothetical protein AAF371_07140 [Pseudomonadota bacterium]